MEMENHILKDEVKEHQVHAEELAEHMDHLRVELDKSQGECTKVCIDSTLRSVPKL